MKSLFCLQDKVILITGGNGHLGKAMCHALAEYGATLILGSRNVEKNKELCEELTKLYNNTNISLELDLEDRKNVIVKIKDLIDKYGRIDILINNSYYGFSGKFHEMDYESWNRGIEGSVGTVFLCTRTVINEMLKIGKGKIINIASMYGINAPNVSELYDGESCEKYYNPVNYGVGKAGIIQFTKYIAAVYGKEGIICNSISPGPFPNFEIQKNKIFVERLSNKVPLKRVGQPEDLKGAIVFLCSDSSNYVNGHDLGIDAGWTVW